MNTMYLPERGRYRVSYSDVGEGGVAVNCEKNTIFPEHPVDRD